MTIPVWFQVASFIVCAVSFTVNTALLLWMLKRGLRGDAGVEGPPGKDGAETIRYLYSPSGLVTGCGHRPNPDYKNPHTNTPDNIT